MIEPYLSSLPLLAHAFLVIFEEFNLKYVPGHPHPWYAGYGVEDGKFHGSMRVMLLECLAESFR
jgi:hypothetical protein